jgi:hypothetical protein
MAVENTLKTSTPDRLRAWSTIQQYLPPRNADYDFWWQLTGRHLALLLEKAGYAIERQYEALMFHYHWSVGECGNSPMSQIGEGI